MKNDKALITAGFIFLFVFYFSILFIGIFYDFRLSFLLLVAFISYQGFISVKNKIKRCEDED